jgi:hypothetical protein
LASGDIGRTLLNLAKESFYKHESQRTIRHGYMASVIKLANLINKHEDKQEVKEYI